MNEHEQRELARIDAEIARARGLRRAGGAFLGVVALYLCIPMLVGAFSGAWGGEIYDPFTGDPVEGDAEPTSCHAEASRLMEESYTLDTLRRRWDEPYRAWQVKCRQQHPDLYKLLNDRRADLVAADKKKR